MLFNRFQHVVQCDRWVCAIPHVFFTASVCCTMLCSECRVKWHAWKYHREFCNEEGDVNEEGDEGIFGG